MQKANKDERIKSLERELEFFKVESKKLQDSVEEKDSKLSTLKNRVAYLEDETKFLMEYIMTSVKKNKLV